MPLDFSVAENRHSDTEPSSSPQATLPALPDLSVRSHPFLLRPMTPAENAPFCELELIFLRIFQGFSRFL
jgi:hypothetical protein